jgi:hypothetical protein
MISSHDIQKQSIWRILLAGGTKISSINKLFCIALGKEIVIDNNVIIMTGGFDYYKETPEIPSADRSYIIGVLSATIDYNNRIETFLPEMDSSTVERFAVGRTTVLSNHNLQARRFVMVRHSDVIVTVQGADATGEIIDLALALNKPILPLPFTGQISMDKWFKNKQSIINYFNIDKETIQYFESVDLSSFKNDLEFTNIARKVKKVITNILKKKCFVIMPFSGTKTCTEEQWTDIFDNIIKPSIELSPYKYECVRANLPVGNIIKDILINLNSADIVIADVTDRNPNVFYELGVRHALKDNTIMITQSLNDVPFDLKHYAIIEYNYTTKKGREDFRSKIHKALEIIETDSKSLLAISPVKEYLNLFS